MESTREAPGGSGSDEGDSLRAVLIGIRYLSHGKENVHLKGPHEDVERIRGFLLARGWKPANILVLRDGYGDIAPTRKNIFDAMEWLVHGATPQHRLVFYCHGMQTKDLNGDEDDGKDEGIVPVDAAVLPVVPVAPVAPVVPIAALVPVDTEFDVVLTRGGGVQVISPRTSPIQTTQGVPSHGCIVDDDLREVLCEWLPAGCRLTALFDMCHSGTALDLEHTATSKNVPLEYHRSWQVMLARLSRVSAGPVASLHDRPHRSSTDPTASDTSPCHRVALRGSRVVPGALGAYRGKESTRSLSAMRTRLSSLIHKCRSLARTFRSMLCNPLLPPDGKGEDTPSNDHADSGAEVEQPRAWCANVPVRERSAWTAALRALGERRPVIADVMSIGSCSDAQGSDDVTTLAQVIPYMFDHYDGFTNVLLLLHLHHKFLPFKQTPQLSSSKPLEWEKPFDI